MLTPRLAGAVTGLVLCVPDLLAQFAPADLANGDVVVHSAEELEHAPAATRRLVVLGGLSAADLPRLVRFAELRELDLTAPRDGGQLAVLARLESLRRLHLFQATLRASDVAAFDALPMLATLELTGSTVDAAACRALASVPTLTTLRLASCQQLDAEAVSAIAAMTRLQRLTIADCQGVPRRSFLQLAALKALRELDLYNNDGGRRRSTRPLPGNADGIGVDDEVLASLASLPHLRQLSLNRCFNLTANGMAALASMPELESLDLTCLESCVAAAVESVPEHLRSFQMSFCAVQPAMLGRMAKRLRELRHLDLSRCEGVDAASLAEVAGMPALESLSLAQIPALGDTDLAALRTCSRLRSLGIGGPNKLTIEGLRALSALPLATIDLRGGGDRGGLGGDGARQTGLTTEAVLQLVHASWPSCRVIDPAGAVH